MGRQRVLVTGGAGFIGSHLVRALLGSGNEVVVLDDLSTGKESNLPESERLRLELGDVADAAAVRRALAGCHAVVHLAAVASVERSIHEPVLTNRTNLVGSIQLFVEAARLGVKRVLYASSAAVYGDASSLPIREDAAPNPLSPYAIDKLAGEQYLAHFHRLGQLNATTFRFFNVFGPRQDPRSPYSGVVSIFLDRALRGSRIAVHGDGRQSRDFIYVGDVVRALTAALDSEGRPHEMPIFNVARGESTSILDLLQLVSGLPGVSAPLEVEHGEARSGDIRHSLADPSRLREELGWQPITPISDGLAAILAHADGAEG